MIKNAMKIKGQNFFEQKNLIRKKILTDMTKVQQKNRN